MTGHYTIFGRLVAAIALYDCALFSWQAATALPRPKRAQRAGTGNRCLRRCRNVGQPILAAAGFQPAPGVSTFSTRLAPTGSAGGLAAGVLCAPETPPQWGGQSWPQPPFRRLSPFSITAHLLLGAAPGFERLGLIANCALRKPPTS